MSMTKTGRCLCACVRQIQRVVCQSECVLATHREVCVFVFLTQKRSGLCACVRQIQGGVCGTEKEVHVGAGYREVSVFLTHRRGV